MYKHKVYNFAGAGLGRIFLKQRASIKPSGRGGYGLRRGYGGADTHALSLAVVDLVVDGDLIEQHVGSRERH